MPLKPLAEVLQADPRFASDMMLSGGEWRPVRLEAHYALVQSVELHRGVPEDVRETFDRARNVVFFAWFCYELLVVAEMQAFSALELGLKIRLRADGWNKESRGLVSLIKEARLRRLMAPAAEAFPGRLDGVDALVRLRNDLAHGTNSLHNPAMAICVLEKSATIVNLLYPSP